MGHAEVGGVGWSGVGHAGVGWGGSCRGGVRWVIQRWDRVAHEKY